MKAVEAQPTNRTGIGTSPKFAQEQAAGADQTAPSSQGDASEIAKVRAAYQKEGRQIGSLPPEPVPSSPVKAVLLDKLGERCAFERTGTRYYDALLQKHRTEGIKKDPTLAELQHFRDEEFAHFELLRRAIASLGGDATVETPAADIAGSDVQRRWSGSHRSPHDLRAMFGGHPRRGVGRQRWVAAAHRGRQRGG